jgi:hypothetical protein
MGHLSFKIATCHAQHSFLRKENSCTNGEFESGIAA